MSKRKQVRVWLEELAEQYEEWATHPPRSNLGREEYTCHALEVGEWGFSDNSPETWACVCMEKVWFEHYGDVSFPAGDTYVSRYDTYGDMWVEVLCEERDERRFEFCHYMADRLRELAEELYG